MNKIQIRTHRKLLPLSIAVALGAFSINSYAATVTATVDYSVGTLVDLAAGDTYAVNDSLSSTTAGVDILAGAADGLGNSVFYHTYGNQTGSFGARVSGTGVYDITSSVTYVDTIMNNTGTAQTYAFDFNIVPGGLSVYGSATDSTQFAYSGYDIEVMFNGAIIFDSAASLNLTQSGTEFIQSGTNLASVAGTNSYNWGNVFQSLNLGSVAAGETATLSYRMTTSARGNINDSVAGTELVTVCDPVFGGEGGEFLGDFIGEIQPPPETVQEANCRVVEQTVFTGTPGGSTSRSGDPLNIYGTTSSNQATIRNTTVSSVPEATSLMLLGLGLVGLGFSRRKKVNFS